MRPPTCPRIARLNQEALEEILRIKSIFCPVPPEPTVVFTYRSFPHRPFPNPVPVPVIVPYDPPYTPPFTYCSTTKKTVFPSNVKSTFHTTLPSTTGKQVFNSNGKSTFYTPLPKSPFKKDREEQIEAINITFAWLITLVFLITICIHIISH
jgi:hypothetical protein